MLTALRRRLRRNDDEGFTLIELLVSMGLFTVLIGVFLSAITVMFRDTARVQAAADNSDEVRRVFFTLDKQLHYANAVNFPGSVSGRQYIEWQTTAVKPGASASCTQWRFDPVAAQLAFRTWDDVTTGATASGVVRGRQPGDQHRVPARVRHDPAEGRRREAAGGRPREGDRRLRQGRDALEQFRRG